MKVQQITSCSYGQNSFKAKVHMDLRTSIFYEKNPDVKRVVDILKKDEIIPKELYLSMIPATDQFCRRYYRLSAQLIDHSGHGKEPNKGDVSYNLQDEDLGDIPMYGNELKLYGCFGNTIVRDVHHDDNTLVDLFNRMFTRNYS